MSDNEQAKLFYELGGRILLAFERMNDDEYVPDVIMKVIDNWMTERNICWCKKDERQIPI